MLQVRKSKPEQPPRILIYGVEGVGKSSFGAKAENPVFISPEGGTDHLNVNEIPGITTWTTLRSVIQQLTVEPHDFKTLVLDSADWIEKLAHAHIIGNSNKSIVTTNGGYGAGFSQSEAMHSELIADLKTLRDRRNMNIIVTAHAHVKQVKDPQAPDDYDSYEIKCHEKVSALWREWVDALLFARFRTYTKASDDTVKARAFSDGTRAVYTVKQPFCQAKNRFNMPAEMDFTENYWTEFMKYARKGVQPESIDDVKKNLMDLANKLTDQKTKDMAIKAITDAGNEQVLALIKNRLNQIA